MQIALSDMESVEVEKALRKTSLMNTLMSLVVAILSTATIGFGFYYNTKATLSQHDSDIQEIKVEAQRTRLKINEIDVFKGVSITEIKNLENKVDKIDEKLDRILNKIN
jgi:hypothetical protein